MTKSGWYGTIDKFLNINSQDLLNSLCQHIYNQSAEQAKISPLEESTIPQLKA